MKLLIAHGGTLCPLEIWPAILVLSAAGGISGARAWIARSRVLRPKTKTAKINAKGDPCRY